MPAILEEQSGYFWWSDEPCPPGHFAPDNAVVGRLTTDEDGLTRLELDGYLPNSSGPASIFADDASALHSRGIHGILKNSNQTVRLFEVHRNGGSLKTQGITFEKYAAWHCLLGDGPFTDTVEPLGFSKLTVDMQGFEEWLRSGAITTERSESGIVVRYAPVESQSYAVTDGELRVDYKIDGPMYGTWRESTVTLTESCAVCYLPAASRSLQEMKDQYGLLADLFILLTGSDFNLNFPILTSAQAKQSFRFFFRRHVSKANALPSWPEHWTNFPQLRPTFGNLFDLWRKRREELGPGIYLYLGTRRSMSLYEEHRFVNLIWGLESLHRRQSPMRPSPHAQQAKMDRILSAIMETKDRKWLKKLFARQIVEPNLEERLVDTLKPLPLGISQKELSAFANECATKRNDISHFGGERHATRYVKGIEDLHQKSEALAYLYHVLLLREIGVDDAMLHDIVYRGPLSHRIKSALVDVGLLPAGALRDPVVQAAHAAAAAETKHRTHAGNIPGTDALTANTATPAASAAPANQAQTPRAESHVLEVDPKQRQQRLRPVSMKGRKPAPDAKRSSKKAPNHKN